MGITISEKLRASKSTVKVIQATSTSTVETARNADHTRKSGHTRPQAPAISLDQPGRLRVAHVLAILGIGHSTLYAGMRVGRYPKPDGRDGAIPYWNTETIRLFLQG